MSALAREGWELKKDEKANIEFKLTKDEVIEFKYVKVEKNPTISIYDHFGTEELTTNDKDKRIIDKNSIAVGDYYEFKPLVKEGWIAKTGIQNGIAGDKDIVLHFFYAKSSSGNGIISGGNDNGGNTDDNTSSNSNPPSSSTDTPVVDVIEDTTPQGAATTDAAPSDDTDDTDTVDDEDTGIEEIDDDITPQGEAGSDEAVAEDPVEVEDDVTPQGNTALPKTGGTNAEVLGLLGLGLVGMAVLFRKKTR